MKKPSLSRWLRRLGLEQFYDALFALAEASRQAAWRALVLCGAAGPRPQPPQRRRGYRPAVEGLEVRLVPSVLQFTSASFSVDEWAGSASITLNRTGSTANTAFTRVQTSDGTAVAGTDYTSINAFVYFAAGSATTSLTVPIADRYLTSGSAALSLSLACASSGDSLGSPSVATLTIDHDDSSVGFSAGSVSVGERDGHVTLTIVRSGAAGGAITVNYATADGSALTGRDYTSTSGTLSMSSGQASATFNVPILDRGLCGGSDSFSVNLSLATPSALGNFTGTGYEAVTINEDDPPTGNPDTYTVSHGHTLSVSATGVLGNDTDPGGPALSVTAVNGSATAVGTATTLPSGAKLTLNSNGSFTYVPDPTRVYDDSFTYTLSDGTLTATTTVTVHVTNAAPVASNDSITVNENSTTTIAASGLLSNDTDSDGDTLVITDFTPTSHGTLALKGSTFTYVPTPNYHGSDTFTYTVSDGLGGTSTATVTVTVNHVNQPPVAKDDWIDTVENTAVSVPVTANDSDPDGDSLSLSSYTQGSHGAVSLASASVAPVYTPTTGYTGEDTFTYTLSDGHGGIATATVHVLVSTGQWANSVIGESSEWTDDGPYDWYAAQALGTPNTFYGDEPTAWAPEPMNGSTEFLTVGFKTPVQATGVLVRETDGNGFVTEIDLLDTSDTYHSIWTGPDTTAAGSAADLIVSLATATSYTVKGVKVTVNTDHDPNNWEEIDAVRLFSAAVSATTPTAPALTSASSLSVDEYGSVNVNVSSLVSASAGDPVFIEISGDPANGTVEVNDNGTPDDFSDDYLTYTPDDLYRGGDSFAFTATDIWGQSVSGTVSVTVNPVNTAPDAEDADAVTTQGSAVTVAVLANDSDVDGDTMTLTAAGTPAHGTASVTSAGVLYTPTTGFTGLDTFSYTISDGNGGTASANVTVLVYPTGQWASSVVAVSSQYDPGDGSTDYAATQALGVPDTFAYGDAPTAWAAANADDGTGASPETLTVGFATPAQATGVVVRETNGNGFVTEVELQDTSGTFHTIWSGTDPSQPDNATDFTVSFPQTSYSVQAVRISVDSNHDVGDYEEIDAVRLLTGGSPSGTSLTTSALNSPPTATDAWASANAGQAVTVAVLANDSDPDGNTLSVQSVGTPGHGTAVINTGSLTVTYTPTTGYSGSDTFTYTTSDGLGGTAMATVHVTVGNGQWANSVLAFSSEANDGTYGTSLYALGTPDSSSYGDTSASWSPDPNSTATTQTLTVGIGTADYATGVLLRETSGNGFVTQVELRDTTGTYHSVWTGTDTTPAGSVTDFLVSISTTAYQVNAIRLTVNPATGDGNPVGIDAVKLLTAGAPPTLPTAPAAANDSATTAENEPVNIQVQANDTNSAGGYLTLRIVSGPSNGTAAVDLHGSLTDSTGAFITYWPDADFSGSDSFTYSLTDAYGQTSTATVSVTVSGVNQPPVAGSATAYTTAGTAVTLNLLANASDPDGDTVSITSETQGQHGTLTVSAGVATYTPGSGFTGEDEFSYVVSDGHSHTDTGTARVSVYEAGQWANSVLQVSSGRDSADSALGTPDDTSWVPADATAEEYLTAGFASATYATGVLVREADGAGAISEVDLLDTAGTYHSLWSGTDPATSASGGAVDFVLNFATTSYQVAGVRVFIDTSTGSGSLDALRLLTGGTATSLTLSGRGLDGSGNYVTTVYTSGGQAGTVKTYTGGTLVDTVVDTYDGSGNLSATEDTDANSHSTYTTFDTAGNKLAQVLAYGTSGAATTTYSYDTNEHLTQVVDPDGNTTTYGYDSAGNQTTMTDPLSHTATQTFDDQNRVATMTNRNGDEIVYSYDTQGRETEEVWYASDGVTVEDTLQWTYNTAGLVATASNNEGTYTYTYDEQGRVSQVEEPFGVTLKFGYDSNGNRDLVKDSFGDEEDSRYSASGQLLSRTLTQGSTVMRLDFTYTAAGEMATIKRYSDAAGTTLIATTTYAYDGQGNVTGIASTDASGSPIDTFNYVYDTAGNLTSEVDNGTTTTYGYDGQGQLTSAGTTGYAYDANGNPANTGDTISTDNQLTSNGTWAYSYDNEGNETQKSLGIYADTWEYTYDAKNHLVQAQEWDAQAGSPRLLLQEVDYKYDVYGNLVERDLDSNGDGTVDNVQRYAYDAWDPAKSSTPTGNENWDVFAQMNGSNALQTRYLRGDVVDQIFGRIETGTSATPYWLLTDHLGSVRTVLDGTGAAKDQISYDAFGNISSETDAAYRGWYAYTGREFDPATGLQDNRGRWYDATTGRWISQDPMGFEAGDSNLYRYARNAPTDATDPSGLKEYSQELINSRTDILKLLGRGRLPFTAGWYFQTRLEGPAGAKVLQVVKVTDVTINFQGKVGLSHKGGEVSEPVYALDTGRFPATDTSSPGGDRPNIPKSKDYILWYRLVEKEFSVPVKGFQLQPGEASGSKISKDRYDEIRNKYLAPEGQRGSFAYEYLYINLKNAKKADLNLKTTAAVLALVDENSRNRINQLLQIAKADFTTKSVAAMLYSKQLMFGGKGVPYLFYAER